MGVPGITVPECKVGPVTINRGFFLTESNEYGVDGKETFSVVGYNYEIQQLRGLITRGESKTSGSVTIRGSNDNDWGPVWIDASTPLPDNDAFPHRGWYLVREVTVELINHIKAKAVLTIELLSTHLLEYLEYDYSRGVDTGVIKGADFDLDTETILLEDYFTSWDSLKWTDMGNYQYADVTTSCSGQYNFAGRRATTVGSPTYAGRIFVSKQTFNPPFYYEITLGNPDLGTAGKIHLTKAHITPGFLQSNNARDCFDIVNHISNRTRYLRLSTYSPKPERTDVYYKPLAMNPMTIRVYMNTAGNVVVWVWDGSNWIKKWQGPTVLSKYRDLRVGFGIFSYDPSAITNHYIDNVKVYRVHQGSIPSIASAPNTGRLLTTPDEVDGYSAYYMNTSERIILQTSKTDPTKIYENSPKGYSSHNTGSVSRIVTGDYERLEAGKFFCQNGSVKLEIESDGINIYKYGSGVYNFLKKFEFGTIDHLKVLNVTPESFKFMANRTEWELRRGESFARVKHVYDDLDFTKETCYYHDEVTTDSPLDDASISMNDENYCLIWDKGSGTCVSPDPAVPYRLMVIKEEPTSIKSDSIPASEITGIGGYDNSKTTSSPTHYMNIALSFLNPTDGRLRIVRG